MYYWLEKPKHHHALHLYSLFLYTLTRCRRLCVNSRDLDQAGNSGGLNKQDLIFFYGIMGCPSSVCLCGVGSINDKCVNTADEFVGLCFFLLLPIIYYKI